MIYSIKEILPFGHSRTVQLCNNESEVVLFLSRYVNKCKNLAEIKIEKVAL